MITSPSTGVTRHLPRALERVAPWLAAFGLYLGIAAVLCRTLLVQLDTALPAPVRVRLENDAALNLWALAWGARALATHPAGAFQANMFYPEPNALAFSEHQLGVAPLFGLLWLISGHAIVAFNAYVIVSYALTGLAMFALARYWTRSLSAALIAGALFAFALPRLSHHFHTQLLSIWWTPLAVLALERFFREPSWPRAAMLGLCVTMQWLSAVYLGWLLAVLMAVYALATIVGRTNLARNPGLWIRGSVAAGVSGIVVLPTLLPYLEVTRRWAFQWPIDELASHSAEPASFLNVSPANVLYGALLRPFESAGGVEQQLFLGVVPLLLGLSGAWVALRPLPAESANHIWLGRACLALIAVALVLCLGPYLMDDRSRPLPYLALYQWVPGFSAMRNPARFIFIVAFGLALLGALAVVRMSALLPGRRSALASVVILGILAAEAQGPLPIQSQAVPDPELMAYLRQGRTPILELPISRERNVPETPRLVVSVQHWRPMVNGFSGFRPPGHEGLAATAQTADPETLARLVTGLGVDTVVVHLDELTGSETGRMSGRGWEAAGFAQRLKTERSLVWELVAPPTLQLATELFADLQLPRTVPSGGAVEARAMLRTAEGQTFLRQGGAQALHVQWEPDGHSAPVIAEELAAGLPLVVVDRPATRVDLELHAPQAPGRYVVHMSGAFQGSTPVTVAASRG